VPGDTLGKIDLDRTARVVQILARVISARVNADKAPAQGIDNSLCDMEDL